MRYYFSLLITILATFIGCNARTQVLTYKKNNSYLNNDLKFIPPPKEAFDLTSVLPLKYTVKGEEDYTSVLNAALQKHRVVKLPDFPIMVNWKGLNVPSDTKVYFQQGSKLIMKPNKEQSYSIINIENVKNVEIYNAVLEGDRRAHLSEKGEWGMGVSIKGSSNIILKNIKIKDCWGDGIYVGATGKRSYNIFIEHFDIDYSRRNGISIINVEYLKVRNGTISNTIGASPQMGIDIEPNSPEDEAKNIQIENVYTFNNRIGIGIVLNPFLKSKVQKMVNISIIGHKDQGSHYPFRVSGRNRNGMYKNYKKYLPVAGEIEVKSPVWEDAVISSSFLSESNEYDFGLLPMIKISSPTIMKKGKKLQYDSELNNNMNNRIREKKLQIIK